MSEKKNPKTIATINFKGGVGKTTVTWCLGDLLATYGTSNVLLSDLDAQMSLTQAISLNEQTGALYDKFGKWFDDCIKKKKTIFNAIEKYTDGTGHFDFPINFTTVYQINDRFHFIPSVEDLYWLELDVLDQNTMKTFVRDLMAKVTYSDKVPSYDYALFDCPPSFTLLSVGFTVCSDAEDSPDSIPPASPLRSMQTGQNSIAPASSLPQLGQVRWGSVLMVLTALQPKATAGSTER
jgi:chromosome partitioning protein